MKLTSFLVYIHPQTQKGTCQAFHKLFHISLSGGRSGEGLQVRELSKNLVRERIQCGPPVAPLVITSASLGSSLGLEGGILGFEKCCLGKFMDSDSGE